MYGGVRSHHFGPVSWVPCFLDNIHISSYSLLTLCVVRVFIRLCTASTITWLGPILFSPPDARLLPPYPDQNNYHSELNMRTRDTRRFARFYKSSCLLSSHLAPPQVRWGRPGFSCDLSALGTVGVPDVYSPPVLNYWVDLGAYPRLLCDLMPACVYANPLGACVRFCVYVLLVY